jgi:hypothetical protein
MIEIFAMHALMIAGFDPERTCTLDARGGAQIGQQI